MLMRFTKAWYQEEFKKRKARAAVNIAAKNGDMPHISTAKCKKCNAQAQQYHHFNGYNEEDHLNVEPLCIACHRKEHE